MIEKSRQYHPDDLAMISLVTERNNSEVGNAKIIKNTFRKRCVYENIFEESGKPKPNNP